jgi:hypothetical protein
MSLVGAHEYLERFVYEPITTAPVIAGGARHRSPRFDPAEFGRFIMRDLKRWLRETQNGGKAAELSRAGQRVLGVLHTRGLVPLMAEARASIPAWGVGTAIDLIAYNRATKNYVCIEIKYSNRAFQWQPPRDGTSEDSPWFRAPYNRIEITLRNQATAQATFGLMLWNVAAPSAALREILVVHVRDNTAIQGRRDFIAEGLGPRNWCTHMAQLMAVTLQMMDGRLYSIKPRRTIVSGGKRRRVAHNDDDADHGDEDG